MSRLLYALQVYHGDVAYGLEVARLHADLCSGTPYHDVEALLVYRRDCPKPTEIENLLKSSFSKVMVYQARRREIDFPAGPNGVWCDLMQFVAEQTKHKIFSYECILTTEADAVPLVLDWPQRLLDAWNREKKSVIGCWHPNGERKEGHINGNALFDPAISSKDFRILGSPPHAAWDTWMAHIFYQLGWADIPEIRNVYRASNLEPRSFEKLRANGCVWLHGVKDASARDWVRRNATSS